MPTNPKKQFARVQAVVLQVDSVMREVRALVGKDCIVFDAPPGCRVTLRDEPVKLRLVQPGDRVQIDYEKIQGRLAARSIDAQSSGVKSYPPPRPDRTIRVH